MHDYLSVHYVLFWLSTGPPRGAGEPVVFFTSTELADPARQQAAWDFLGIPPASSSLSAGLHVMLSEEAMHKIQERHNTCSKEQFAKLKAKDTAPAPLAEPDPFTTLAIIEPDEVIPPNTLQVFSPQQLQALEAAGLPPGQLQLSFKLSIMLRPQLEQCCRLMQRHLPALGRYKELPLDKLQVSPTTTWGSQASEQQSLV
jgi:hypothetical protein